MDHSDEVGKKNLVVLKAEIEPLANSTQKVHGEKVQGIVGDSASTPVRFWPRRVGVACQHEAHLESLARVWGLRWRRRKELEELKAEFHRWRLMQGHSATR